MRTVVLSDDRTSGGELILNPEYPALGAHGSAQSLRQYHPLV